MNATGEVPNTVKRQKTRTAVVLLSNDTPPEPYQWHDEKSNTSANFVQGETSQTSLKLLGG